MNIQEVKKFLGSYTELFGFIENDDYVIAKPKNKIAKETFSAIGKLVRQESGEYVAFDYTSKTGGYFRFKKEAKSAATLDKKGFLVKDALAYLDDIEKKVVIVREKLEELQQ